MNLFNHVQIKVKDLNVSRSFYEPLMSVLGYNVVLNIENSVIGYGTSVHDMFEIRQADASCPLSVSVHLAFNAPTKEAVDAFFDAAINAGAKPNGEPGYREYEEGYYAAFIIDPDGHNIEAVFHKGDAN